MNCLKRIFGGKAVPADESVSIPIGSAVEKFFISYADVAKTKTESLRLLNEIRNGNSLIRVIGRSLFFDAKFPFSSAFGTFAMLVVERMNDHKLDFANTREAMDYRSCFDVALCMVDTSETHLYEAGEQLLTIGWSENLRSELAQIIGTIDARFATKI
ncbi:MAG: hypothetical protein LBF26_00530 [Puniceicoccales bacterium]|jgi:hypothetical protein|nr:hypothetical protein [Puniceicoccales bacterium]